MNIVVYLLIPAAKGSNGIALYHAFALPFLVFPFTSIPLVYHAIVAVVRDGGAYSGYRNSHRSARPQSTPKPADSWQKIKGDKKKKRQPSALFFPPHPSIPSRPSTLQVTPPLFGPSPFLMITLPIFHLTLFCPDNPSPISDVTVPCVCSPVQHFFSSQDPIFRFPSYFYLLPIYLSASPLCICSFLLPSAHLLLCVHKHKRSNTHTHTHPFLSVFPPAVCSPYCRLSHRGLATDLIRVSVVAKVESVALRFTAGT